MHYRFHPLHGQQVQILYRARRENDWVAVIDPQGIQLKIPAWMLLPEASQYDLSNQAEISAIALLRLCDLLGIEANEDMVDATKPAGSRGGKQRLPKNRP